MPTKETKATADIGERLFFHRHAKRWSQIEAARRSGVSREAIGKVERGENSPTLSTLRRLARAYGVTVEELRNGPIPERRRG